MGTNITMTTKPLNFEEALAYFKKKIPMTEEQFRELAENARQRAFTVAGITRLDIIQDLLDELTQALAEGRTAQDFKKNIRERMKDKGWQGLTPYRLDTIFRTNVQTAYQVGRYQQMKAPEVVESRPYWMYDAVNDGGTRPSHRAMDGMVRRHDDPIWDLWYPPNGFRCRCKAISLSAAAVARRGLKIAEGDLPQRIDTSTGEILQMEPDKGFKSNPAADPWEPDLSRYDSGLKNAFIKK